MPAIQRNAEDLRPRTSERHTTAPTIMTLNGHFAAVSGRTPTKEEFAHGIQVVDEDKSFNPNLSSYLALEKVISAGFNYHLISVFGSQSTGKSTLLNHLFGTDFGVMAESDRRQTTKGIWMSKDKKGPVETGAVGGERRKTAENILVMDVEGTDGRERGEDQDFERKSALFALATSEVLIVNIWEHQVGLYQGANMGLLKTVFEVNLQLFLKSRDTNSRSLLFFVIRDHIGTTPLSNLRRTLLQDLTNIWGSISKPSGLEKARIHDYFDFAFVALPHKVLQPDRFVDEVAKLRTRFREGYRDAKHSALLGEEDVDGPVFLPEYHRRIPADGFPHYAESVWEQIVSNKDLDLPTQQELLAQFRCDEISREVLIIFDEAIAPLEKEQADNVRLGKTALLRGLGQIMSQARTQVLKAFETEASRYHKGVYSRKKTELTSKVDGRLRVLFQGQLAASHKLGTKSFVEGVSAAVKAGQKKRTTDDFGATVEKEKARVLARFVSEAREAAVKGCSWSNHDQELQLFRKELVEVSARLRREEIRRLASRVERWVRSRLADSVGLEFNKLGSGRGGLGAPETGTKPDEKDLWDRVWNVFVGVVEEAEGRFAERAGSFDASPEEVEVGRWRLRRQSWAALRAKIDEEVMEGNLLLKLRENFEDKFRYDEAGVPRVWRPADDIEGLFTGARESTLELIPLLSRFRLSSTSASPPLPEWIAPAPASVGGAEEEEDMPPIGGVDDDDTKTLEDEMTVLSEAKRQDLTVRFKKTADGVFVEARRSAIGGVAQIPIYFYALLLALGWNEIVAVLRNPLYFVMLALLSIGAYVTYTLNLWGPMVRMANAASQQALEIAKERLRDFLENSDAGRQAHARAMAMSGRTSGSRTTRGVDGKANHTGDDDDDDEAYDAIPMDRLGSDGRRRQQQSQQQQRQTGRGSRQQTPANVDDDDND